MRSSALVAAVACLLLAPVPSPAATEAQALRDALHLPPLPALPLPQRPRGAELDIGLSPPDQDVDAALAKLAQFERLAEQRQWVPAASKLQEIIDRHGDAVIPLTANTYAPARRYAASRLLALGDDAVRAYRAASEPAAARLLQAARTGRSSPELLAVARRYPATASALEALDLLATIELERGRAASAAQLLSTRVALDPAPRPDSNALAKLAVALSRSGARDTLSRLLPVLQARRADRVERAAGPVPLSDFARSLLDAMPATPETPPCAIAPRASTPGALLWQVPLSKPRPFRRRVEPQAPAKTLPPEFAMLLPVISGHVVYCQSSEDLKAIDLATGTVLWRVDVRDGARQDTSRSTPAELALIAPVATRDALIVTFPTPTVQDDPGPQRHEVLTGRIDAFPLRSAEPPTSTLWSVNSIEEARRTDPEPVLPLRFTSPPSLVGDVVCIAARYSESDSETFLIAYDPATGRRLWRTRLAAANWAADPARWNLFANTPPPAARGAVAYSCSDLGTVAAVDTTDGSLLWATRYDRDPSVVCKLETIGGQSAAVQAPPNPPLLAGNSLFVLPADSAFLYALDPVTGALRWRRSRDDGRASFLHLLAADDQSLYLSGSAVTCLDARDGATRWRSVLLDSFPVGRGAVARDYVLCPIESSIALIDVRAQGRLADSIPWTQWRNSAAARGDSDLGISSAWRQSTPVGSGNLLIADHRLLIARNDSLSAFAARGAEPLLRDRVARDPAEPAHLLDLAAFYASTGRWTEAADAYRLALRTLKPDTGRAAAVRRFLAQTCDQLAARFEKEHAWPKAAAALDEALNLSTNDNPLAAWLQLRKAAALDKAADPLRALSVYHNLIASLGHMELRIPEDFIHNTNELTTRADLIAAVAIADIIRRHGREAYRPFEASAREMIRGAADPAAVFEAAARLYPASEAVADLRLSRAADALRARRLGTAAAELLAIERLCPGVRAAEVLALRSQLAAASQPQSMPPTPPRKGTALLDTVWRAWPAAAPAAEEAVADLDARASGQHLADLLPYAAGKSLEAYDLQTGKLAWCAAAGFLGIEFQDPTTSPPNQPRPAAEFRKILPDFPADKAGARPGDLLLAFDGIRLKRKWDLVQLCTTTPAGREVELLVLRQPAAGDPDPTRRPFPLTLRPVLAPRPETGGTIGDARFAPTSPHEFVRLVGIEGSAIITNVDLALLWLDRATGRTLTRTIVEPLPTDVPYTGDRRLQLLLARGHAPVIDSGFIIVPTPSGRLHCFDLAGVRRWSVELPNQVILRLVPWNGKVVALAAQLDQPAPTVQPTLLVLDTLSGFELLRAHLPGPDLPDAYHLLPLSTGTSATDAPPKDRLIVSASRQLLCYELARDGLAARASKPWSIDAASLQSTHCSPPIAARDAVVVLFHPKTLVALAPDSGRITWTKVLPDAPADVICIDGHVFLPFCADRGYSVACHRMSDGRELWHTPLKADVRLSQARDPVPYASVIDGRLFIAQNLLDRDQRPEPSIAAIRLSDGKLLRYVGLDRGTGYNNVLSGKTGRGVIGLVMESGLFGLSTDGPVPDPAGNAPAPK